MKPQTLYRGSDNKKAKLSKCEKVFNSMQKMNRKTLALAPKKEVVA